MFFYTIQTFLGITGANEETLHPLVLLNESRNFGFLYKFTDSLVLQILLPSKKLGTVN